MLCKKHIDRDALFYCMGCGGYFCQECVYVNEAKASLPYTCRSCGGRCEKMAQKESSSEHVSGPVMASETAEVLITTSFWSEIIPSFIYPFRKNGKIMLLVGSIFFSIFFAIARMAWLFGLPLLLILVSYILEYMLLVLETSAYGDNQPPEFPGMNDWTELIFGRLFLIILAAVVCFVPSVIYLFKAQQADAVFLALIVLGQFIYPMMFLIIAMTGKFVAFNPFLIANSILKAPLQYLIIVALFFAAAYVSRTIKMLLIGLPILGFFISDLISFYIMLIQMRLLGIFYRCNEENFTSVPKGT
ncbi:MAG: hypothetical protein PHI86_01680 [Candidatus Omnitrophica bacterium]|nr:hypothetical protein [Candidatus Omnitrophota bacterium]HOX54838.1 hypothetical protein [Candidatus Omnitrophota bacterium]